MKSKKSPKVKKSKRSEDGFANIHCKESGAITILKSSGSKGSDNSASASPKESVSAKRKRSSSRAERGEFKSDSDTREMPYRPSLDLNFAEEIWPMKRSVLFKPDRLRYVRKMEKPKGCVFCLAVEKGVQPETLLIYKGKNAIVILNKYPYNNGHALVLPRRHCGDFLQLSDNEQKEINRCLKRIIQALTETYEPAGFNVGLNLGSAAGAGIPEHLHYHVIPRWRGDTNFFPLIAQTKVVVETLEQTFERLVPYFSGNFKKGNA